MNYRRCGQSGLLLSEISLGLWHNFSESDDYQRSKSIIHRAFEQGVTQFDLANNYGIPAGSAERTFGKILKDGFASQRNKIIVTTKAGHQMWDGPYGDWASRKHLIASCDESLARMGLDYVDIFYSHRYDSQTPIEETVGALEYIVKSGRALYIGLSKYPADKLREAVELLRAARVPVIVNQEKYSLLHRDPEVCHFALHSELGLGFVSFSPLAQGQLTDKYFDGIPVGSRASTGGFLKEEEVLKNLDKVREFKKEADQYGVSLSQYAILWQLRDKRVTSVIVGVSSEAQLIDNLKIVK